jgi:hypothetical protein
VRVATGFLRMEVGFDEVEVEAWRTGRRCAVEARIKDGSDDGVVDGR